MSSCDESDGTAATDNATVYFPKLGMAHGKSEIGLLAQRFALEINRIEHDIDNFNVIPSSEYVVIEGQAKSTTYSGGTFPDNVYSHGRFCNVFDFDGDLIKRMHIHEDPDFNSADAPRVEWAKKVHESFAQHRASL
jgi:hypothetical protein